MKNLKDKIHNAQNRRFGELSSCFYETYKNSVKPHGCHIHCNAAGMAMAKNSLVSHNIMVYHTVNVYYDVVRKV